MIEIKNVTIRLSSNLRDIRDSKNLTQTDLAKISGLSVRCIKNIELGNSIPILLNAYKLAECLDTSIEALFPYTVEGKAK